MKAKPPGDTSSYCPMCLLDTMGKIMEKSSVKRQQFGFERPHSTKDVISAMVSMIKEALNSGGNCPVVVMGVKIELTFTNWIKIRDALADIDASGYLASLVENSLTEITL